MEGDMRILFQNAGSSFPRSNLTVPSSFWTKSINDMVELGALDVFERGEVLSFSVQPLHANNPSFGNIQNLDANGFPFIDGGYDAVEGINDASQSNNKVDPIVRLPNAILTIGFHGYRIIQQPGVVY
jgi:hypothetical protein